MSFISKCFKTVLIIAALLFVTFASKYVSFFFSDLFGALGGAIAGALFLGLAAAQGFSSFRKIWFPNKKDFDQNKNNNSPNLSDYADRSKEQTELVPWSLKEPDNSSVVGSCPHCAGNPSTKRCNFCFKEPSMKICPFCAEKVKYAAIKCKHCYSDISGSESN